jgi:putative heme-binding domain-containing protein
MKLVLILCATSLAAQNPAAQNEVTRNPRTSPADVAAGAKTFRSHCAACHGIHGEGARGPNLATGVFYHGATDLALLTTISDGIPGTEMPGLFYSPDRVWQVVAYIRSLNSAGTRPPGDPAHGKMLFRDKGCNQCHRVGGEGGRIGPDLTSIGGARSVNHLRQAMVDPNADVRERYWVVNLTTKQGQAFTGFLMNEDSYTVQFMDMNEQLHSMAKSDLARYSVDKTSKMPSYRGLLKENEENDLVAYLWSLRPARRDDEKP